MGPERAHGAAASGPPRDPEASDDAADELEDARIRRGLAGYSPSASTRSASREDEDLRRSGNCAATTWRRLLVADDLALVRAELARLRAAAEADPRVHSRLGLTADGRMASSPSLRPSSSWGGACSPLVTRSRNFSGAALEASARPSARAAAAVASASRRELLRGDPWEGCRELQLEELLLWYHDFATQRSPEAAPSMPLPLQAEASLRCGGSGSLVERRRSYDLGRSSLASVSTAASLADATKMGGSAASTAGCLLGATRESRSIVSSPSAPCLPGACVPGSNSTSSAYFTVSLAARKLPSQQALARGACRLELTVPLDPALPPRSPAPAQALPQAWELLPSRQPAGGALLPPPRWARGATLAASAAELAPPAAVDAWEEEFLWRCEVDPGSDG
eukprot:TRINITY_DN45525_c0_g1_i1.p1 TRINITY_DN45525_c0_g1~~TRINITY_DN45525_c0_g1_i1.p1  ORF type:complete len:395 (+),score=77.12 TRINITY_DN45525_c0_g1_i1:79-1263(+)